MVGGRAQRSSAREAVIPSPLYTNSGVPYRSASCRYRAGSSSWSADMVSPCRELERHACQAARCHWFAAPARSNRTQVQVGCQAVHPYTPARNESADPLQRDHRMVPPSLPAGNAGTFPGGTVRREPVVAAGQFWLAAINPSVSAARTASVLVGQLSLMRMLATNRLAPCIEIPSSRAICLLLSPSTSSASVSRSRAVRLAGPDRLTGGRLRSRSSISRTISGDMGTCSSRSWASAAASREAPSPGNSRYPSAPRRNRPRIASGLRSSISTSTLPPATLAMVATRVTSSNSPPQIITTSNASISALNTEAHAKSPTGPTSGMVRKMPLMPNRMIALFETMPTEHAAGRSADRTCCMAMRISVEWNEELRASTMIRSVQALTPAGVPTIRPCSYAQTRIPGTLLQVDPHVHAEVAQRQVRLIVVLHPRGHLLPFNPHPVWPGKKPDPPPRDVMYND